MEPQTITRPPANKLADWVNDAPTIEMSAQRYDQIVHGVMPSSTSTLTSPLHR